MVLIEMLLNDPQILAVRPPDKVKGVTHKRDGANKRIDTDIKAHAY